MTHEQLGQLWLLTVKLRRARLRVDSLVMQRDAFNSACDHLMPDGSRALIHGTKVCEICGKVVS